MTAERDIYLRILAYGLADDASITHPNVEAVNWKKFYSFCETQAILGIGLQCIDKLKSQLGGDLKIPQDILLQWIGLVEQIKAQNQLLNERTKGIIEYFKSHGKRSCILKGQGNAQMYPEPKLRTPGDIDVWLEGTKREIVKFVHNRYPDINVQYHHMAYPVFDDVEVEIHYYPSFCYNKWNNYKLQKYFIENSNEQFKNKTNIGYCVPTVSFNLIFQLSHMMRHFFTQGIGLRHAIDYYYLLMQEMTMQQKEETVATMKGCGMYKFFRALMWIEVTILGLNSNVDIVEPHERAGRMVLTEMLKGGNFGHQYDRKQKGKIAFYAEQMLHNMNYIAEFPSEPMSRPFALVWDYARKQFNYNTNTSKLMTGKY